MKKLLKEAYYGLRVIFHPFDGFWCIQREGAASLKSALIWIFLLVLTYAIRCEVTGYVYLATTQEEVSLIKNIITVLLPIFLWTVSNWALTALMEGESTFKDIIVSTAFSTIPITLFNLPIAFFSHIISADQTMVYLLLCSIPLIWTGFLIFSSILTCNQYTVLKTITTIILIVLAMAFIVFLAVLFVNMINTMLSFFITIFKEVTFRL